jgi:hypothetical protein
VSNTLRTLLQQYESKNNLESRNSEIIGGLGSSQIPQNIRGPGGSYYQQNINNGGTSGSSSIVEQINGVDRP